MSRTTTRLLCLSLIATLCLGSLPATVQAGEGTGEGSPQDREKYWRERQGGISAENLATAVESASRLPVGSLPRAAGHPDEPEKALPPGGSPWQSLGPAPIRERNPGGSPDTFSGRVSALATHPTNPLVVYAGGANGGVWKSVDGGVTWAPMPGETTRPFLAIGSIAIDPNDPNVVYAGTGEPNGGSSVGGGGVYKTTDGGSSWTLLGSGSPFPLGGKIYRLVVGPDSRVWAATPQGLLRSADGGATWKAIGNGLPKNIEVWDFALSADASVHFAVVRNHGLFRLRSSDTSWLQLTASPLPSGTAPWDRRARIAVAPSNAQTAFLILDVNGRISGFSTTNRGNAWTAANPLLGSFTVSTQGFYNMEVAIDPRAPGIVYVGGIDLAVNTNATGGGGWLPVTPKTHVDQHAIAFPACAAAPCPLLLGNDGGVFHLTPTNPFDFGITSVAERNDTLRITEFVGGDLGLDFIADPVALGGSQDNGTLRFHQFDPANQTPLEWDHVIGADGGFAFLSHVPGAPDNERAYAETQIPGFGGTGLETSFDQGRTFTVFNLNLPINQAAFYPVYTLDRADAQHLAAAAADAVWEILAPQSQWFQSSQDFGARPTALAIAPSASHVIYAGFCSGRVFRTTTGYRFPPGPPYEEKSNGLPVGTCGAGAMTINAIAVDRNDPLRAYLAGSTPGASARVVYGTSDGGGTWSNLSGNLPAGLAAYSLVTYPTTTGRAIVVGTEAGAYFSTNEGGTWTKLANGLPNTRVAQLALDAGLTTLAAFTGGRGAFVTGIAGAACTFDLSPTSGSYPAGGGQTAVAIDTQPGCAWTASSPVPWATVAPTSGSGDGSVTVNVAANPDAGIRNTTLTIATRPFGVSQAGSGACTYFVSPTQASFGAGGGAGSSNVTTTSGCTWTAASQAPWISVTGGSSGNGSGAVFYSVASNPTPSPRTGTLSVAGFTVIVNQQAGSTGGCTVSSIDTTSLTFPRQGGFAFIGFDVTPSGCAWFVTVNDSWIHVDPTEGSGQGAIQVFADGGNNSRDGSFSINGTVVSVHQN